MINYDKLLYSGWWIWCLRSPIIRWSSCPLEQVGSLVYANFLSIIRSAYIGNSKLSCCSAFCSIGNVNVVGGSWSKNCANFENSVSIRAQPANRSTAKSVRVQKPDNGARQVNFDPWIALVNRNENQEAVVIRERHEDLDHKSFRGLEMMRGRWCVRAPPPPIMHAASNHGYTFCNFKDMNPVLWCKFQGGYIYVWSRLSNQELKQAWTYSRTETNTIFKGQSTRSSIIDTTK